MIKRLQNLCSRACLLLLLALILAAGAAGMAERHLPDSISVFAGETPTVGSGMTLTPSGEEVAHHHYTVGSATVKLLGLLPVKEIEVRRYEALSLCPGGSLFGLRAPLGGVLVTAVAEVEGTGGRSPAREAGLARGDLITAVDGQAVTDAEALAARVKGSGGAPLSLSVSRGGRSLTVRLTPCALTNGEYRAGLLVKDSVAGIGTVTFVDPETGFFAGLGHGVYDGISHSPVTIGRGIVTEVGLTGVCPGTSGTPGELRGHLESARLGTLLSNTECGVFGILATPTVGEAIPIGLRGEVHLGEAEILSTVEEGAPRRYRIEIIALRGEKGSDRSFSIRVTDEHLLAVTGGIVQGMSGSPIIQDGKLVGAVTHVMISDPTAGYGIFIENMLNAANIPMAKAS